MFYNESEPVKKLINSAKDGVRYVFEYVDEHTDAELIEVRADLKAYMARYGRISQVWAFLSILVAIGIVVIPGIWSTVWSFIIGSDAGNIAAGITSFILLIYMIFFMRPFRIGSYHKALSMLDDCCKLRKRIC